MPQFERYVGIDYSGAKTPTSSLKGLRVYLAQRGASPAEVLPPAGPRKYWTRRGIAEWLVERLSEETPTLVGIDHGFSFPIQYFEAHNLNHDWAAFLDDFRLHWPTDQDNTRVDDVRSGKQGDGKARMGDSRWRRLTERRAGAAKGVFLFGAEGEVAKSTHAGLPWLRHIREGTGARVHFWPFEGWDLAAGRSVVVEVYPALWRNAFQQGGRTDDQHDAYAVAEWLRHADAGGTLGESFHPPLEPQERATASIEGWILGVMAGKPAGSRRGTGDSARDGEDQGSRRGPVEALREGDDQPGFPIRPKDIRYIKLGEGGDWEQECIEKGIIRFGFGSANAERFGLCRDGRWTELAQSFIAEGRTKGTATRFTRETRLFFEDPGSTLWITFVGERLCWGFLTPAAAERHADGKGVYRAVDGGWKSTDRHGEELTKDGLSGALTKLAAYRGTSCKVDVAPYAIRRINGEKTPEVEYALAAVEKTRASVRQLMRLLGPRDFETLVDLVFTTTGWRRLGPVGKTQKTLDLDLVLPTTGERAFVQVKSRTTSAEVADYVARLDDLGSYDRMFFVFHSGEADTDDERVTLIGPEKLSEMVVEVGLVGWLIRKVS